ncbi:MAG: hypothetical protein OHK0012_11980 [Synechococcales cyanobacterium]
MSVWGKIPSKFQRDLLWEGRYSQSNIRLYSSGMTDFRADFESKFGGWNATASALTTKYGLRSNQMEGGVLT